ncbi:MAG: hypothetical protein AB8G17_15590 [Gammaproteobacteria bacterium]
MIADLERVLRIETHDAQLEKNGSEIRIFFDSLDVWRALLGMLDYVGNSPGGGLSVEKKIDFESPGALVAALLGSGALGPFSLLPPHQAELLRLLERKRSENLPSSKHREEEFLAELDVLRHGDPTDLRNLSHEQIREIVKRESDDAPRLYKAVQCVRFQWWQRLKIWHKDDLLVLQSVPTRTAALTARPEFPAILSVIKRKRPSGQKQTTRYNDFADAVALATLLQLCDDAREGKSHLIPRFFDSVGWFSDVASEAGILEKLTVCTRSDERGNRTISTPVLVPADYFVFKASFLKRAGPNGRKNAGEPLSAEDIYTALQEIIAGEHASKDGLEALRHVSVGNQTLEEVIEQLKALGFLRNVWLETAADKEIKELTDRLRETSREALEKEYQKALGEIIVSAKDALATNADEYRRLTQAWIWAEQSLERISDLKEVRPREVTRDYKLICFGFHKDATEQVGEIISDLTSDEAREANESLHDSVGFRKLVEALSEGLGDPLANEINTQVAAATMWCASSPADVVQLLRHNWNQFNHASLKLVFAAACFDSRMELDLGKRTLDSLCEAHARSSIEIQSQMTDNVSLMLFAELSIGLAYLHFHLWSVEKGRWNWRQQEFSNKRPPDHALNTIETAISFASQACDVLGTESRPDKLWRQLLLYAQNQRLFYLLELGSHDRFDEIESAAPHLLGMNNDPDLVMFTYYDTLARYFHFRSVWSDTKSDWESLLDSAIRYQGDAVKGRPSDRVHSQFEDLLRLTKANKFDRRLSLRMNGAMPDGDTEQ